MPSPDMRMGNAHTYACAAALALNKPESGHNIGASLCVPDLVRDVCQGRGAGGADHASETPGAIVQNGTNHQREVQRPTLTASASIHERALDDAARAAVVDRWRHHIEPHRRAGCPPRDVRGPRCLPAALGAPFTHEVRC